MVRHFWLRYIGDAHGATAVEYGLLLGLLVIAIIGGIAAVGGETHNNFNATVEAYPDR
ncbi:MAG: Flp family type IVb pilin [Henriciella sp.]|uniref:Flp family type IVb pilin n=1 Tax=Henriciella sp. TaxID=1968823 RepID=UPI003C775340